MNESDEQRALENTAEMWLMAALAKLIEIAKKQHRSKTDLEVVERIEAEIYPRIA